MRLLVVILLGAVMLGITDTWLGVKWPAGIAGSAARVLWLGSGCVIYYAVRERCLMKARIVRGSFKGHEAAVVRTKGSFAMLHLSGVGYLSLWADWFVIV